MLFIPAGAPRRTRDKKFFAEGPGRASVSGRWSRCGGGTHDKDCYAKVGTFEGEVIPIL